MVLIVLDLAEEDTRTCLHTGRIVKLDLNVADGIEKLTRRLVNGTRKVKLVAIRVAFRANDKNVLTDGIVKLKTDVVTDTRRIFRSARSRIVSLGRNDLRLIKDLDKGLIDEEIALGILEVDVIGLNLARQIGIGERRQGQ
jgi:hypothetical protein